jgi:hypothetical protein
MVLEKIPPILSSNLISDAFVGLSSLRTGDSTGCSAYSFNLRLLHVGCLLGALVSVRPNSRPSQVTDTYATMKCGTHGVRDSIAQNFGPAMIREWENREGRSYRCCGRFTSSNDSNKFN